MRRRPACTHTDALALALRDAAAALGARGWALAAADDPLRLALPPVAAVDSAPDAVLSAWAALYLNAELEDAGVLSLVEMLADQRRALALREVGTQQRLERFALGIEQNPNRLDRSRLYGRLFGGSPSAERPDFRQRLLRLALAVVRADAEHLRGAEGHASRAAWRAAAQALLALAAAEPAGTLLSWARRIHARTLAAFDMLGDIGLQRQLSTTTPWQTLQRLLAGDPAQRDAAARRGSAGQTLLRGLSRAADAAWPDTETVQAAYRWLVASGLPVALLLPQQQGQRAWA